MDILGRPPIHPLPLWLGKLALAVSCLFLVLPAFGVDWSWVALPALRPWALALVCLAIPVLALSFLRLGRSLRVGLPDDPTSLVTTGIYAFSRNPIYLGMYLLCIASCLYTPNPVNLLCAIIGICIHHRVVLAEEKFLAARFGSAWADYCRRVRRYL